MGLLPPRLGDVRISTAVLPVEYGRCAAEALCAIDTHRPDAVVLTGLAAGRTAVTPERIAINVRDTGGAGSAEGFADNAGYAPVDVPIIDAGPAGIFATLPNRLIVSALREAGLPAEISSTAGTYICNETMYAVLHSFSGVAGPGPLAGFIHVPDVDVLPVEETVRALSVVAEVVGGVVAGDPRMAG